MMQVWWMTVYKFIHPDVNALSHSGLRFQTELVRSMSYQQLEQLMDRDVPNNVGNSGVVFYTLKREMFVDLYINDVVYVLVFSTNFLNPGSWYHIAFAYSGDTIFRGNINFEWKLNNRALFSRPKFTAEPFLGSGYLENQTQGNQVKGTGFGTIDALLVFLISYQLLKLRN